TIAREDPQMLVAPQAMITEEGPMKKLIDAAHEIERRESVLNVTVAGGFPYSDVPDAGMAITVTTDKDQKLAEEYARQLCKLAWNLKNEFAVKEVNFREAIAKTKTIPNQPVIWAEGSDNVGGGAPADATHVLKHLIDLEMSSLIVICDEQVARTAHEL